MSRLLRPLGISVALIVIFSISSPVSATTPQKPVPHAIAIGDANGFVAVGETTTPEGAVIDTFQSGDVSIKVIGTPGAMVSFYPSAANADKEHGVQIAMMTTRPKTEKDATRYRDSGRTVVGDLVALGVPRADAEREFGAMETGGATNPYLAATTTPVYDTQCATITQGAGHIHGYGCSTFYRTYAKGTDWWFNDTMKVSAYSDDNSIWHPKRLIQLGWRVTWSANNVIYDWEPSGPINTNCSTVTIGVTSPFGGVSIGAPVCQSNLQPWTVTSTRSGGVWNGIESGSNGYEAAVAAQSVHNPPTAATSYQSAWTLTYIEL